MGGIVGLLFREFAVTVTVGRRHVGLRLAHPDAGDVRALPASAQTRPQARPPRPDVRGRLRGRAALSTIAACNGCCATSSPTLVSTIVLVVLTGWLYVVIPKGFFPEQDTGFIFGQAEARQDISFAAMADLADRARRDRAEGSRRSRRRGLRRARPAAIRRRTPRRMFIQLKPFGERDASAQQIIQRLRPKVAEVPGVKFFMQAGQDINVGGRLSKTEFQYTLTSTDSEELNHWAPIIEEAMAQAARAAGRDSDQQIASPHLAIDIDRDSASRLGLSLVADRPDAVRRLRPAPGGDDLYVEHAIQGRARGAAGVPDRPGGAVAHLRHRRRTARRCRSAPWRSFTNKIAPLTINHQGQFPAVTLSFNLAPGAALGEAVAGDPADAARAQDADHARRLASRARRRPSSRR